MTACSEMVTETTLLDVRGLRVYFPTPEGVVKALDDVSFSIEAGKTLAMVGESGCGKSTVGRALLRILDEPGNIEAGQILWRDRPEIGTDQIDIVRQEPDGPRMRSIRGGQIGLVFQEPMTALSPVHTIGNQIQEMIRLHLPVSSSEAKERAMDLLNHVGIPDAPRRIDQYSFELSGGLRQRALIAMAIACNPRLLIADEPTTALDVTTQAQILDLLRELQDESGMAVLLITHDLGVVAEMADDVVVLYLGRTVESGTADEIFSDPKHPYTKALLRSMPSISVPSRTKLPSIRGSVPHPFNRPSGCPFHPRCESAIAGICDLNMPVFRSLPRSGRKVSCLLYQREMGDRNDA